MTNLWQRMNAQTAIKGGSQVADYVSHKLSLCITEPNIDSEQNRHPPSLIWLFACWVIFHALLSADFFKKLTFSNYPKRHIWKLMQVTQKASQVTQNTSWKECRWLHGQVRWLKSTSRKQCRWLDWHKSGDSKAHLENNAGDWTDK